MQPTLKVDSDPHTLDQTQEQPRARVFLTRVSTLGCTCIYNSPVTGLLFPFHKTDCPQHHDEFVDQLDQPHSVNVLANRNWLTHHPSNPRPCTNDFVSFINNVEFQEHIAGYPDENGIQLAQSVLACSMVSISDHLVVAPAPQVRFVATALFWILALILIIVVLAGQELMWWLHWNADFT